MVPTAARSVRLTSRAASKFRAGCGRYERGCGRCPARLTPACRSFSPRRGVRVSWSRGRLLCGLPRGRHRLRAGCRFTSPARCCLGARDARRLTTSRRPFVMVPAAAASGSDCGRYKLRAGCRVTSRPPARCYPSDGCGFVRQPRAHWKHSGWKNAPSLSINSAPTLLGGASSYEGRAAAACPPSGSRPVRPSVIVKFSPARGGPVTPDDARRGSVNTMSTAAVCIRLRGTPDSA
jgi:hypothetical protein